MNAGGAPGEIRNLYLRNKFCSIITAKPVPYFLVLFAVFNHVGSLPFT